jgi:23S rRNA U2552 (ribose-2'-O)-methylase RlmE/FtsJ
LKETNLNLPGVYTYAQDATQLDKVEEILQNHGIEKFDVITSDMAPNTI